MPEANLNAQKDSVQRKEFLREFVSRATMIVEDLGSSNAWNLVLEDFEKQRKLLDDNWQYVMDEKKMHEFRVSKMAVHKILNLVNDYKNDLKMAGDELNAIENPKTNIIRDVDTE
jgi:hypothetical protein